jgi:hypothetical protein
VDIRRYEKLGYPDSQLTHPHASRAQQSGAGFVLTLAGTRTFNLCRRQT